MVVSEEKPTVVPTASVNKKKKRANVKVRM